MSSDRRQQVGLYRDVCSLYLAVFCRELDQQMCECRGGRPWFPVPKCTCGLYGRKATLNTKCLRAQGSTSLFSIPYGLCGRKATLKKNSSVLVAVLILVISIPWRMCMCGCMDRKVDGCVDGAREERSVRVWERRDRQTDSETDIHGN